MAGQNIATALDATLGERIAGKGRASWLGRGAVLALQPARLATEVGPSTMPESSLACACAETTEAHPS